MQPLLAKLGIEVAAFGPGAVAVQSFPSFLERLDPLAFVRELLERGEQELLDLHEEELLHEVLDMMACKAAVKAGDPLTAGGDRGAARPARAGGASQQLPARPADDAAAVAAGSWRSSSSGRDSD